MPRAVGQKQGGEVEILQRAAFARNGFMKNALIVLILCLIISGCSDKTETDRLRNELEACRKTNTELKAQKEKLTADRQNHQVDKLGALLIDQVVNEVMVVDFVVENLRAFQFEHEVLSDNFPHLNAELLVSTQKNAVTGKEAPPLSVSERNALNNHVLAILNDKNRLARYYKAFKEPMVRAVANYQRESFGDYLNVTEFLGEIQQGFVDLLDPVKLKAVEEYVQAEEKLKSLDFKSLSEAQQQKVRLKWSNIENSRKELSPKHFAYRRFVQSGENRELIELYVNLLGDFIEAVKYDVKNKVNMEKQHIGFKMVVPGMYSLNNKVVDNPYEWFALYQTNDSLELKKTDLQYILTKEPINDEQVQYISAPGKEEPLLLLKGAEWLREGPVDLFLGSTYLSIERLEKKPNTVFEQSNALKIEIIKPQAGEKAQDYFGRQVDSYNFGIQVRSQGITQKVSHYFNPGFTFFNINWVGDLDRDGKPDLMTTAEFEGKAYADRQLYLSRDAKDGELFKEFVPSDPDAEGC